MGGGGGGGVGVGVFYGYYCSINIENVIIYIMLDYPSWNVMRKDLVLIEKLITY